MKKIVVHFVRKESQLRSSFIKNQIVSHINFKPVIVFRKSDKASNNEYIFARDITKKVPTLNLGDNETIIERLLFRFLKRLSIRQKLILIRKIEEINPDILHFHYGTDAGIYLKALRNTNIPKVVSFYGYDCFSFPKLYFGYGRIYLLNRVFKQASKILAMSYEMREDLHKIGCKSDKIIIHYHGIPSELATIHKEYCHKPRLNVLMLSYLDPVKGHIFSLQALKVLIDKGIKNIRIRIVGRGHYRSKIQQYIATSGLDEYVELVGAVDYLSAEYFNEYKSADVFLHPSVTTKTDKEGIPGSLVEAMIAGLPVIATRHGGIPYVIENDKTGLLVDECDVVALAEALMKILKSDTLRRNLGESARKYALYNLDLKRKEKELENIYIQLIIASAN